MTPPAGQGAQKVPFNDPARQYLALRKQIDAAIRRVLESGRYIMGPDHDAFEADFAAYCGLRHCVAVGNGTDALELALRAAGCEAGDEVITVANAGMYTTIACLAIGATPVYADVEESLTMAPEVLPSLITERTRAVVVTHLYGKLAKIEEILRQVENTGISVIEDCAQAHGARLDKKAGSFGHLAAFSFYPTKNLGAIGDGGAVVTDSDELAGRVRQLRQYGWQKKYRPTIAGGRNSRLDPLQAAILRVKLPYLDQWNDRRRAIVNRYREAAAGTEVTVVHAPARDYVAHLCVVRHPKRERLQGELNAAGIAHDIHYPVSDHRQPVVKRSRFRTGMLKETERAENEILSIPCFPEMRDDEVDFVCDVLRRM